MKPAIVLALAGLLAAQTAPDPSNRGPLSVSMQEYRVNRVQVRAIPYPVDIWGRVFYPEGMTGGPYPLVLMMHGNHGICRLPGTMTDLGAVNPPNCAPGQVETPNHAGYDYVAEQLASHGYIVASMNVNAVNVRVNGIPERGRLAQEHLEYFRLWNSAEGAAPFGRLFSGRVDLDNIGLFGHSRGGEGVRAAYTMNRQEGSPFGIKAVLELSPVDFGRSALPNSPLYNADNVAFSVLLSACDWDVSDNSGMRAYDRTRVLPETIFPSPKSQVYFVGANHNFSNTEWTPEDPFLRCIDFPVITTRAEQLDVSAVYIAGFFRTYLGGEKLDSLFKGDSAPPAKVRTPTHVSYTESPSRIYVIEDFRRRETPEINTAGGINRWVNLSITGCRDLACNDPLPGDWFTDPETTTGKIAWPGASGTGTASVLALDAAEGGAPKDFSPFAFVAFRVAAGFDMRNPMTPQGQAFSIMLIDAGGAESNRVATSDYQTIPFPTGAIYRRAMPKTIRIPLRAFRGVDLTRITRVQFVFDRVPQGSIYLTDVHVTP